MPHYKDKVPSRAWSMIICYSMFYCLTSLATQGLGMILPSMAEQFDLTLTQQGQLSTMGFLIQVICGIPFAMLSIKLGGRMSLAVLLCCGIAGYFLHGFALGFGMLLVGRALVCVGQVCLQGPSNIVKTNWVPLSRVSQVAGIEEFSSSMGFLIGTAAVAFFISILNGWQHMMTFFGCIEGVILIVWMFVYRDNPEKNVILSREPFIKPLKEALKHKEVWLLAIGWPGTSFVWIAVTTFWPTYAEENLDLTLGQIGWAVGMVPLFSAVACIVSPILTEIIGRDKLMLWPWGIILPLAYGGTLVFHSYFMILFCFAVAGFGAYAFVPIAIGTVYKIPGIDESCIGTGITFIFTFANIGSALAGVCSAALANAFGLHTAMLITCLSPLLWLILTIFIPEYGRKAQEKAARAE